MKQRFYIVIDSKKEIDPKDILFALRKARPNWGNMSASLAQPLRAMDAASALPAEQNPRSNIVPAVEFDTQPRP